MYRSGYNKRLDLNKVWASLQREYHVLKTHPLIDFFEDEQRFDRYSLCLDQALLVDYSKNHLVENTLHLLVSLARKSGVEQGIDQLFNGTYISGTEKGKKVLHTKLRDFDALSKNQSKGLAFPQQDQHRIAILSQDILSGAWKGFTGKKIKTVVNIGIGGSHLGPKMLTTALQAYKTHIDVKYLSSVDGTNLHSLLNSLEAESTIFIVVSKSFRTQETLANAARVKKSLLDSGLTTDFFERHFFAISDNPLKAKQFGIISQHIFSIGEGVGGRFSICGTTSLSVMLSIGIENFEAFLKGAYLMDRHFKTRDLEKNIPVILALIDIWYQNFWVFTSHLILPYDVSLKHFSTYLQQLIMESNGKSFDKSGCDVGYDTGPLIWGGVGTDVQHSFFQLLYQGTQRLHCDFLCSVNPLHPFLESHQELVAHFLSQSKALMVGDFQKSEGASEEKNKSGNFYSQGNRPSNTLLYREVNPKTLGILVSLYEHRTFVQGLIWHINSFDQWGVEAGKAHYRNLLPYVREESESSFDASTKGLLQFYHEHSKSNS